MPNRSTELRWEAPDDSPLRKQIIDAAIEIADEGNLGLVTVRAVAGRVGCRPMGLYAHVPSKAGLLALMFDRISGTLLISKPLPTDGKAALRAIAVKAFDTYVEHPWMLAAFGHRPPPGPNQLRRAEQSAQAATAFTADDTEAWNVVSMVHDWTMGHALHVLTLRQDEALAAALRTANSGEHPIAAEALGRAPNIATGDAFQAHLDVLLGALEAQFAGSGPAAASA